MPSRCYKDKIDAIRLQPCLLYSSSKGALLLTYRLSKDCGKLEKRSEMMNYAEGIKVGLGSTEHGLWLLWGQYRQPSIYFG
jgi:hypothetical protein